MRHWFALPLLAFATPAAADWQYTRWGMPLDEVIAASSGKATLVPEEKGKRIRKLQRLAIGSVTEGKAEFQVEFYFDKKKLKLIRYVPTSKISCGEEEQLLIEQFGPAEPSTMQFQFTTMNKAVGKSRKLKWAYPVENQLTFSTLWFEREDMPGIKTEQICTAVIEPKEAA
ncbi:MULTISPECIES: hypothetical protein [unclassified Novosphingobium]|uniref:hypothetical protein n=1 Tax=unclassified Novosphingobium TaxID=2644732 RepID=UPI0025DEF69A|nr:MULTISPECIES: hypothetical protein [unclassified Novosphingobium]HQV04889.1 hypothetical protein [Novosphingobium sp.]